VENAAFVRKSDENADLIQRYWSLMEIDILAPQAARFHVEAVLRTASFTPSARNFYLKFRADSGIITNLNLT
jgi:hypothetical protein